MTSHVIGGGGGGDGKVHVPSSSNARQDGVGGGSGVEQDYRVTGHYAASDAPSTGGPNFDRELLWYLSGPMTGYEEHNFPAFTSACGVLRRTGIKVSSAHEVKHDEAEHGKGTLPWTDYLRGDLKELLLCDGIIMLKGWPKSKGARLELDIAMSLEYPVWFYDNYKLTEM